MKSRLKRILRLKSPYRLLSCSIARFPEVFNRALHGVDLHGMTLHGMTLHGVDLPV